MATSSTPLLANSSKALIIGFLLTHIVLNIEHYDIHAKKKIVPMIIRQTWYYQAVIHYHMSHHAHTPLSKGIYGITNPWFDLFLHRTGISTLVNKIIQRFLRYIDKKIYI